MTENSTPDIIALYLKLAPGGDLDTLVPCFTSDAQVIDEGKTYRGHDEIRGWREAVAAEFTYTMSVVGTEAAGVVRSPTAGTARYVVTAELEGTSPGVRSLEVSLRAARRSDLRARDRTMT